MPQLDKVIILDQVILVCIFLLLTYFLISVFVLPNLFVSLSYRYLKLVSLRSVFWDYSNKVIDKEEVFSQLISEFFVLCSSFVHLLKSLFYFSLGPIVKKVLLLLSFSSKSILMSSFFLNSFLSSKNLSFNSLNLKEFKISYLF